MPSDSWLRKDDSDFLLVLRALSIFIIVVGHLGAFWIWKPWSEFLNVFVQIFFFISGAMSYNSFIKSETAGKYLRRRIVALLTPYYCICVFSLIVFIFMTKALPSFSIVNLLRWVTVNPDNAIMPFPLGQVWFLHTLIIIVLASPLLFWLYRHHLAIFNIYLMVAIVLSVIQLQYSFGSNLIIAGQNLYKPIIHSLFFCLGFLVLDIPRLRSSLFSCVAFSVFVSLSISIVKCFEINPDYGLHLYHPDIYCVTGSLSALWGLIFFQKQIVKIYAMLPLLHASVQFLFRHTFSIFLLHTFSIFFVEEVFGIVNPPEKTVFYALSKFSTVLGLTILICPFFTEVSSSLCKIIIRFVQNADETHSSYLSNLRDPPHTL
jgi:peptidoglycan/LPS O-acetylase OafA/YrhL